MYCHHCGRELSDGSRFCNYCGTPMEHMPQHAEPEPQGETSDYTPLHAEPLEPADPVRYVDAKYTDGGYSEYDVTSDGATRVFTPLSGIEEPAEDVSPVRDREEIDDFYDDYQEDDTVERYGTRRNTDPREASAPWYKNPWVWVAVGAVVVILMVVVIIASASGTGHKGSTKPTTAPTQPSTAAPTRQVTEPPTQAPTDPPTEAPTDPPTQAPTDPPTEAPTDPPTEAPTDPPTDPPTEVTETPVGDPTVE